MAKSKTFKNEKEKKDYEKQSILITFGLYILSFFICLFYFKLDYFLSLGIAGFVVIGLYLVGYASTFWINGILKSVEKVSTK